MPLLKDKNISPGLAASRKPTNHAKWPTTLKQLALLLASITAVILIFCPNCFRSNLEYTLINIAYSTVMFIGLWQANGWLTCYLDKRLPWFDNLAKRLVVSVVATLVVSTVVVFLISGSFLLIRGVALQNLGAQVLRNNLYVPLFITLFISLIMHSRGFLLSWREMAINVERLQKENILSQYESLKAQVNPHFLFNSLNALTSLVETDQKLAVKFIRKLSEVYRYLLDSSQKEVVPLQQEIDFIQSYFYLQQIRHGNAILLQNDLPPDGNIVVPPLALQLLLENAIKHNMALEESPLRIHLYLEDDYLVVQNNLQERRARETSTATGLQNIKSRYSFLTNKKVQIQQTDQHFTVKLPILHIKENAHTYS